MGEWLLRKAAKSKEGNVAEFFFYFSRNQFEEVFILFFRFPPTELHHREKVWKLESPLHGVLCKCQPTT